MIATPTLAEVNATWLSPHTLVPALERLLRDNRPDATRVVLRPLFACLQDRPDTWFHAESSPPSDGHAKLLASAANNAGRAGSQPTPARPASHAGSQPTPARPASRAGSQPTPARPASRAGSQPTPARPASRAGSQPTPAR
ncbi:MAG: hypothetical protein IT317_05965, partial [Anaerolineales bacterium]|nr:hypothetical protein [Anaerolineales bacterium]